MGRQMPARVWERQLRQSATRARLVELSEPCSAWLMVNTNQNLVGVTELTSRMGLEDAFGDALRQLIRWKWALFWQLRCPAHKIASGCGK